MNTIERIQKLPEKKREQILWAVVGATLVILLLLWIATSQIPRRPKSASNFFKMVQERTNRARADFPR